MTKTPIANSFNQPATKGRFFEMTEMSAVTVGAAGEAGEVGGEVGGAGRSNELIKRAI